MLLKNVELNMSLCSIEYQFCVCIHLITKNLR